jgi:peptide chain release factor 2
MEAEAAAPGFWDDPQSAQRTMQRLSTLTAETALWRGVEGEAEALAELLEMGIHEGETELTQELAAETAALASRLGDLEFQLVLSGPYDDHDAILTVSAGAGGTDSQDWAQMLLRMYLRWAEARGFAARVLDTSPGEETGIKSATVEISGRQAFGWLRTDGGVHRLVRLSPFDSDHQRHTSFALVEVLPEAASDVEVVIADDDLRIDTFRASGHGGQNVQKVESAVRITHMPTGIVVTCQNERSQVQNREVAMKVLRARLMDRELQLRAEEMARVRGAHVTPGWGNQIRSYVLHPYRMVKDHRTGFETRDPQAVLDGDLDPLLRSALLDAVGRDSGG